MPTLMAILTVLHRPLLAGLELACSLPSFQETEELGFFVELAHVDRQPTEYLPTTTTPQLPTSVITLAAPTPSTRVLSMPSPVVNNLFVPQQPLSQLGASLLSSLLVLSVFWIISLMAVALSCKSFRHAFLRNIAAVRSSALQRVSKIYSPVINLMRDIRRKLSKVRLASVLSRKQMLSTRLGISKATSDLPMCCPYKEEFLNYLLKLATYMDAARLPNKNIFLALVTVPAATALSIALAFLIGLLKPTTAIEINPRKSIVIDGKCNISKTFWNQKLLARLGIFIAVLDIIFQVNTAFDIPYRAYLAALSSRTDMAMLVYHDVLLGFAAVPALSAPTIAIEMDPRKPSAAIFVAGKRTGQRQRFLLRSMIVQQDHTAHSVVHIRERYHSVLRARQDSLAISTNWAGLKAAAFFIFHVILIVVVADGIYALKSIAAVPSSVSDPMELLKIHSARPGRNLSPSTVPRVLELHTPLKNPLTATLTFIPGSPQDLAVSHQCIHYLTTICSSSLNALNEQHSLPPSRVRSYYIVVMVPPINTSSPFRFSGSMDAHYAGVYDRILRAIRRYRNALDDEFVYDMGLFLGLSRIIHLLYFRLAA
ncbi:hypothetical protein K439DRAFT_1611482 [Ramaria rubella]|nr:hypothetical protein K439DRAFT_1611482 [Ramaria rubella]